MLATFRIPSYRRTWLAAAMLGLGVWLERLAVGWFVLDASGSVFLAAFSFALRSMPNLVLGPIAGAVSDRLPRQRVLATVALVRLATLLAMGATVLVDDGAVGIILALVFLNGCSNAFRTTSLQALIADTVPPDRLGSAISLTSFGERAIGGLGMLAGGFLLASIGPGPTFLLGAIPLAAAAALFLTIPGRAAPAGRPAHFRADVLDGLRLIVQVPMVRLLLGMMVLVEILGFSFDSLMPSVADRVLQVGPEGLGVLTASVSAGSVVGTFALALVADRWPRGSMLLGVFAGFGALLVALSLSGSLLLSAFIAAGIGAMAALVDALEWMMLQTSVPPDLRGRAIGGWNFAIGFGWLGPVTLGALADTAGVQVALATAGTLLLAVALTMASTAASLRSSERPG